MRKDGNKGETKLKEERRKKRENGGKKTFETHFILRRKERRKKEIYRRMRGKDEKQPSTEKEWTENDEETATYREKNKTR